MRWSLARDWQALVRFDRYYLELQRLGRADDESLVAKTVALSQKTGIPVVATNDVRFLAASDFESHEARVCISDGALLTDPSRRAQIHRGAVPAHARGDGRSSLPTFPRRWRIPWRSRAAARCRSSSANRACLTIRCPKARPSRRTSAPKRERGFAEREKVFDASQLARITEYRDRLRARARRHLPDGLPGLLPDRRGLHPLGARQRRAGGAGPRLGRRIAGGLQPRHHRHRSAEVRPAVRALPESRTRVDARLRHRLLHGRARPRHRIRLAEVRTRARLADHHLRHHGREGRGARRGPRARHGLRLRRQDRQAHSVRARHHARRRASRKSPSSSVSTRKTRRSRISSTSRVRSRASRATPACTPVAW